MPSATESAAPSVHPDQINEVMADCMALEEVRVVRRLLMVRCWVIAAAIAVGGAWLGLLHSFAYWFSVGIFALAPAGVWIVELHRERGLRKKVVKSL